MSGKKEHKSDSTKKPDKMVGTHREFLDMDTDEEDFGRQESPEVEEEFPPEPEKPVFSEEELMILVRYVKDLTVFSTNEDAIWNEDCDDIVREYFENPSHVVLCIFHEGNDLSAGLRIPEDAPKGFTYFLRSPWQIYTPENFMNTVSFGSIAENTKSSILKFMENIYAPIVLHSDDYASFIRSDVFLNLHEFIIHLMEVVYRPMHLTALYVPKERLLKTFLEPSEEINCFLLGENKDSIFSEEDERKRKLVDRLEKVVWSWIRQIRVATRSISRRKKVENMSEAVDYWKTKYRNLNYLRAQVRNEEILLIIDILRNLRSPSANEFEKLTTLIERRLNEASSNLMYLNVLFDFCKDLNVPDDAENSITEALHLILFIWTESPFYSNTNNAETLCQALSAQIIHQCKKYIQLDVALGSNPEDGIEMLEKCIFCCDIYEIIYNNLTTVVVSHINPENKWGVNKREVFSHIDVFKRRCYDVIEICKALLVFGRCDKVGTLGSPKGTQYEAYCREIENIFYESLNEIIIARDTIFIVTNSKWLNKIRQFRYTVLQLENMATNLINDLFKEVQNIEEGIEAIYALQKFRKRESLRKLLQTKWTQVWKIFNNEIEYCYINAISELKEYEQSKEKINVNVNMLCISRYLKSQYTKMINALDWIGDCDVEKCIVQRYKHVSDVIDERRKMFNIYNTYGTQ